MSWNTMLWKNWCNTTSAIIPWFKDAQALNVTVFTIWSSAQPGKAHISLQHDALKPLTAPFLLPQQERLRVL